MNPSREPEKRSSALSLSKTLGVSVLIGSGITAIALAATLLGLKEDAIERTTYLWAWILSYGIPCFLLMGGAVAFLALTPKRINLLPAYSVYGIVSGALILIGGFPLGILLQKWEFFISLLVIGVCIGAIGLLTLKAYKEEFRKG
ncbi:MAG: hypothetical protein SPG64_01765 [Candidatus Enteromonas sp.]|nr:hypothetical protein [Candidatus Enteromonas sp.]